MKQTLVFATNNLNKLREVQEMMPPGIELKSLADIGCTADIPETADTLEGNAEIKARYVFDNYHLNTFADDTGLEVEALDNRPGVYSARYAGETATPEECMQKVLNELKGHANRTARFRTVIALIIDGRTHYFDGEVRGRIIEEERGTEGFGYDPVFIPEGYDHTFAELGENIKNTISHRARAIQKMCEFLTK